MSSGQERRRFSRVTFHRPAVLDLKSARLRCQVEDLSLKGALVEVPVDSPVIPRSGQVCSLLVELDAGGDAVIRMDGEVAYLRGTHVGFRCDEVDLESIQHLRRVVEVNVADESVLHRELASLVAERDW